MSAIKETLSTLKFAQRAKMIRNKAIVNEENSDAEYWRRKYHALVKQMGEGAPMPKAQLMGSGLEGDQQCDSNSNPPTKSWDNLLSQ